MKQIIVVFLMLSFVINAQTWQQKVDYKMIIDMDVETHQYDGKQEIIYKNNSPDLLNKLYFHLYNNAFQPNSAMDVKVQNTIDPDERMVVNIGTKDKPIHKSKIALLKKEEQGFLEIKKLTQKGVPLTYRIEGTILEVELNKPIKSGKKTVLEIQFLGQVPLQIRRSGRDNKEGVAFSMTQWYPKLAAYDEEGWHANPYLGAEFYADWGDYEVEIKIDKEYTVGGSGYLQNPQQIGHGYQDFDKPLKLNEQDGKLIWKFKAPRVHDFSWAADTDYEHLIHKVSNGPKVHLFYKKNLDDDKKEFWKKLPNIMNRLFSFYQTEVGAYPYKQYSVLQGGDGGMEYAMCTLITGNRSYKSLVAVVAHELAHSWFQFMLASNETKHPWLDEGFTTYMSTIIESKILNNDVDSEFSLKYLSYLNLIEHKIEQPLTTHGDSYHYSYGYGVSSYNKGALFLYQLEYIIGKPALKQALKTYYNNYAFKHPKPESFLRIAEKTAEMELDWYYNFFIETTEAVDYRVKSIESNKVILERKRNMPIPIEVEVTYVDGDIERFYIPLDVMRGEKQLNATVLKDWAWVKPIYTFELDKPIQSVLIDPDDKTIDTDKNNNFLLGN